MSRIFLQMGGIGLVQETWGMSRRNAKYMNRMQRARSWELEARWGHIARLLVRTLE